MGNVPKSEKALEFETRRRALLMEEQKERDDRRAAFIKAVKELATEFRCQIVGVPKLVPGEKGWSIAVDVDAIAAPKV